MPQIDNCRQEIEAALGRTLTPREIGEVARQANKVKQKIDAANGDPRVANQIMKDYVDQRVAARAAKKEQAAASAIAFEKQKARLAASDFADKAPHEYLRGLMVGSLKDYFGGKNSLGVNISRESAQRQIAYIADLKKAGIDKYAFDRADAKNMWLSRAALEDGNDHTIYGANAAKWAEVTKRHQDAIMADHRASGIVRGHVESYVQGQTHDPTALAKAGRNTFGSNASRDQWVSDVAPKIDWTKTMGGEFANATASQRAQRLGEIWSQFVAGKHLEWSPSDPLRSRELIFKTPEDGFNYHQQYGRDMALGESVMHQLGRQGRDLAIAREWGPNAEGNIRKFISDLQKQHVENAGKTNALAKAENSVMRHYWPSLSGQLASPENAGVASWIARARGFLATAKIGASLPVLFGDIPLRANMIARYGDGAFLKGLAQTTGDMFRGLSKDEKVRLANANGIMLNGMGLPMTEGMRDYAGVDIAGKLNMAILKYGGHNAWTDAIRTNVMAREGFEHWSDRGRAFADLTEGRQRLLRQFGIDSKEWDIMRSQSPLELQRGWSAFSAQGVREMDTDAFKSLAPDGASDNQLRAARTALADKYRNLMGEMADRVTTAPSEEMKAITLRGTKAGTWEGEAIRSFNELKGFLYNYTRNHVMGNAMGYDADPMNVGWGHAMWRMATGQGTRQGYVSLAKLAAAGAGFGYIMNTLRDIADGKTPENPMTHPGDTLARAMARQSLGVMSNLVFSQAGKPESGIRDKIADAFGPTVETVADVVDTLGKTGYHLGKFALAPGYTEDQFYKDFGRDASKMASTVYRSIPGNNLIWTKWATDYFVYNQMMNLMNPDYTKRLQQRMMKERGQSYLLGPQ